MENEIYLVLSMVLLSRNTRKLRILLVMIESIPAYRPPPNNAPQVNVTSTSDQKQISGFQKSGLKVIVILGTLNRPLPEIFSFIGLCFKPRCMDLNSVLSIKTANTILITVIDMIIIIRIPF